MMFIVIMCMPFFLGNHTIAILKGTEDYDTVSTGFAATFQEIDGLQQLGFVSVNGVNYKIELFFSSDMKVCDVIV